jgi:hypothetical protein
VTEGGGPRGTWRADEFSPDIDAIRMERPEPAFIVDGEEFR